MLDQILRTLLTKNNGSAIPPLVAIDQQILIGVINHSRTGVFF